MTALAGSVAEVRRAVAYIAWRLITGQDGLALYDHTDDIRVTFTGAVGESGIDVVDNAGSRVVGSGGSGMYTLEPKSSLGSRKPVTLKISGLDFEGFDYAAACRYSGSVDRRSMSVSQGREGATFSYSID